VTGIGLLALGRFAGVALAGMIAAIWAGRHLPPSTLGAMALIMLWFLLGRVFSCCAFAAAGAASSRQAEAPRSPGPLTLVSVAGTLAATYGLVRQAGRAYSGNILRFGGRVTVREALQA